MDECNYMYKGFDIMDVNKKSKIRNEYFNPYGYNIYSSKREEKDLTRSIIRTNQDEKRV